MAAGGHFVCPKLAFDGISKKKLSTVLNHSIESEFWTSKMGSGGHFVKIYIFF